MSNAPERYLTWRKDTADETPRVMMERHAGKQNSATFIIPKEDHTLGNLVRSRLLQDPSVKFAGYRVPHPLVFECHIRLETENKPDTAPPEVLIRNLRKISGETETISNAFKTALNDFNKGVTNTSLSNRR